MEKLKVMFVCMGNICRSPLAHGVFSKMLEDRGLKKYIEVESSGTTAYHVGELPDSRMAKVARAHGYILDHRARGFYASDLDEYDLVLAMDKDNLSDIKSQSRKENKARVQLFREYDPQGGQGAEVPDPYYGGPQGFMNVFSIVERSCRKLLDELEKKLGAE